MMDELVTRLREHAEWADGNEWEVPITLPDDLRKAADSIEKLSGNLVKLKHCPFCGSTTAPEVSTLADADFVEEGSPEYEFASTHYLVVCNYNNGGCGAHSSCRNETPIEADKKWNARADNG